MGSAQQGVASKRVLVPISDGTEELEAVAIIDTLRRAGAQVTVASVTSGLQVTCSRRVRLVADALIQDCANERYDLIVLPGGMPGAERLRDSAVLTELLKRQQAAGGLIGAICASPAVVLQHHGLLGQRQATAYPGFTERLSHPDATARVVTDDSCVTSQGPGTALELALTLVEQLFGAATAQAVAEQMLARR